MPAPLSEVTRADSENYFVGESFQRKLFPSKSRFARGGFEGFAGDEGDSPYAQFAAANEGQISTPGPSRLALLKPGPEPLQSSSVFGQVFHPIDLTATNQGGLSTQMEHELDRETETILCHDAMGHFRKCKTCRDKVIYELQNLNATSESYVLGETAKRKKNELSEMASLAGAGIFTIFLIDAFSKFGARLR